MKLLIKIAAVLVVLVLLLVLGAALAIDSLTARAVEKGGTYALGTETTLRDADVGLMSGELELNGLKVANPAGFESDHFLELGHGAMQVDPESFSKDVVVVPTFTLSQVDVILEYGQGKTNYGVILDNLERFESGEKKDAEPGQKRFVIQKLAIRDIAAHVRLLPATGAATEVDLTVPSIELSDVGSGGGLSVSELIAQIVQVILSSTLTAGGASIPVDVLDDLREELGDLEGDWKRKLDETLGGTVEDVEKAIEKGLEVLKGGN